MVTANGLEVAFQRAGEGPPLVFVHGAASDARLWQPQLSEFADGFTAVAWDEPGAGGSSDIPRDFTLGDYAGALAALIGELGLGPAHLVGLSWGGTVMLELYRRQPELVASLVFAGSYAGWKGSLPAEEVQTRLTGMRQMLAADVFDPTLPGLFAAEPPPDVLRLLEQVARDVRPASLEIQLSVMGEADLQSVLPSIRAPTLLVWGEQDVRSPLAVARQFERSIPGARLVVIPDCGHVSNLERATEFNRAVREFLDT